MVKPNSFAFLLLSGRENGGVILNANTPCSLICNFAQEHGLFDPPEYTRQYKPKLVRVENTPWPFNSKIETNEGSMVPACTKASV